MRHGIYGLFITFLFFGIPLVVYYKLAQKSKIVTYLGYLASLVYIGILLPQITTVIRPEEKVLAKINLYSLIIFAIIATYILVKNIFSHSLFRNRNKGIAQNPPPQ
jgi:uncharacterized protein with PQ loop repeat